MKSHDSAVCKCLESQTRFPKLTPILYTRRLRHLVDTARLQAAGDVFQMRFSEVQWTR